MSNTSLTSLASSAALLLALSSGGCGDAPAYDDSAETSQDLSTSVVGRFSLSGPAGSRWIQDVILRSDGTFTGNFGNNVSNLSGHHFEAAGTYTVQSSSSGSALVFRFDLCQGCATVTESYPFSVRPDGRLEVRLPDDVPFTLERAADARLGEPPGEVDLVYRFLHEGVGYTKEVHGTLTAGRPFRFLWDGRRASCGSGFAPFLKGRFFDASGHATFFSSRLDRIHVSGWLLTTVVALPPGAKRVDLWVHETACNKYDSDFGRNFSFPLR